MIKLKKLLLEEKLAFKLYREGKIKYSVIINDEYSVNINLLSINPDEYLGYITLTSNFNDLGNITPNPNYLFVDFIQVKQKGEGFGLLLYQSALKYCLKHNYKGIVSGKEHRIGRTENIWSTIKTSDDKYYTYADTSALHKIKI